MVCVLPMMGRKVRSITSGPAWPNHCQTTLSGTLDVVSQCRAALWRRL